MAFVLALLALQEPSAPEGFRVERLHAAEAGSWVAMAFDPRGRLVLSPEQGPLVRVSLGEAVRVEPIAVPVRDAQGLLFAAGSLYVNGNGPRGTGLYRLRERDGKFEEATLLKKWGIVMTEHGPHGIALGPDGKLYVMNGNYTPLPEGLSPRSPYRNYGEDLLLPRQWDATGHAVGLVAPGGCVLRTDPDGKEWELICGGLRNAYDLAFSPDGQLFTYDSDMERDLGTPWYRPTRVLRLVEGGEYGWRSGTGKWPAYYADSLPAALDVGRGSPTGVAFGTKGRFPSRYRRALFAADWALGRILAVHLETPSFEPFVQGAPLNVTDLEFGPDGALYFITGGRGTRSHLYRVVWTGQAGEEPSRGRAATRPDLDSPDRWARWAARLELERRDVSSWKEGALREARRNASLEGLIALARCGPKELQGDLLEALGWHPWRELTDEQRLTLLRAYQLAFIRMGRPAPGQAATVAARLDALYPGPSVPINRELSQLLVYLGAPGVVPRTVAFLAGGTVEDQMHAAFVLRNAREGWGPAERTAYFEWFRRARYSGDVGFGLFVRNVRLDALSTLSEAERKDLEPLLQEDYVASAREARPQFPFVKEWKLEEVWKEVEGGLGKRNFMRGRAAFAKAECLACHRLGLEGGAIGPDLTGIGRRFGRRDLLEAIFLPSKAVSDQYRNTVLHTEDDVVSGRVVREDADRVWVQPNPLEAARVEVRKSAVRAKRLSELSPMPEGLLNTLTRYEVLDLVAYLESGADENHPAFRR